MFESEIKAALRDHPLGGLRIFQQIGSTNDEALTWALQGAADLSLVVADEQTAGRGRAGRRWYTPAGAALAFSLILKPTQDVRGYEERLSGLGALALTDVFEGLGLPAAIKWPNDVLIRGRKAAGILVESAWNGPTLEASIVGIGVNILRASVPPDGTVSFPATCIETELDRSTSRTALLVEVLSRLVAWRGRLADDEFTRVWNDRLAFVGQSVILTRDAQPPLTGQVIGLGSDGSLCLEAGGEIVRVQIGELQLRPTNDRIG
jgi:BirA family biotin operon repressor/biotin-[acetyl-CoA-carboxylase] ligase